MFLRKADKIEELTEKVRNLEAYIQDKDLTLAGVRESRDYYLRLYNNLLSQQPPTLEQQLEEARRVNKELQDKKTLDHLLVQNERLQKENN